MTLSANDFFPSAHENDGYTSLYNVTSCVVSLCLQLPLSYNGTIFALTNLSTKKEIILF